MQRITAKGQRGATAAVQAAVVRAWYYEDHDRLSRFCTLVRTGQDADGYTTPADTMAVALRDWMMAGVNTGQVKYTNMSIILRHPNGDEARRWSSRSTLWAPRAPTTVECATIRRGNGSAGASVNPAAARSRPPARATAAHRPL